MRSLAGTWPGLEFVLNQADHDEQDKDFLGQRANFDGIDIIDVIMEQPATARFIAAKLYRYFVNQQLHQADEVQLGELLAELKFDISAYLRTLFISRDFYAPHNVGSHIRSPVEMVVSTYRLMQLDHLPGVPDFNVVTGSLGQRLMHPPTVAGWSQGQSWITPSLLFERANFILDVVFPDIGFIPPDRYPGYTAEIVNVQNRLRQGMTISEATRPTGVSDEDGMAASNLLADQDEDFNTRLGSMRGWQMALERVKPIPRDTAAVDLAGMVSAARVETPADVVELLVERFFVVRPAQSVLNQLAEVLTDELGTTDVAMAHSYMEEPLRKVLHRLLSLPEYQLG